MDLIYERYRIFLILGKYCFLEITAHEYTSTHPGCSAKTVVAYFDGFLCHYSRLTERLEEFFMYPCTETKCEACARICHDMGIHTSGDSVIRLLIKRYEKQPPSRCSSVIEIVNFSYKKDILMKRLLWMKARTSQ